MKNLLLPILILSLISSCKTINKRKIDDANTFYEAGTSALVQGDYTSALTRLLQAIELNPDNPYYHNNLAFTYQVKKLPKKAEFHFKRALELKKDFPDAQNNLGVLYLEMGQPKKAIPLSLEAAQNPLYKTPSKAYLNVGRAYYKLKDYKKAVLYQRKAVEHDSGFCYAYNRLGMSLIKTKKYTSATKSLKKAISLCKTYEAPYYVLGLNYVRSQKKDLALKQFNVLIRKFPEGKYSAKAKKLIQSLKK